MSEVEIHQENTLAKVRCIDRQAYGRSRLALSRNAGTNQNSHGKQWRRGQLQRGSDGPHCLGVWRKGLAQERMIRVRQVGATQFRHQADAGDAERISYLSLRAQS